MSLLTPLYVLGALAISLPVVFHLIRRTPKGEFPFSSLMFLSPSPPRLTRRSRLEHLLLLLLRGLAIGLLALAFSRPFLREPTSPDAGAGDARRLAVLVDTSASMKRGDLWRQANQAVDAVLREARPLDQLAVYTCADRLRPLVSFEEMAEIPPAQRREFVMQRLGASSPTWSGTQLGRGLMELVEIVNIGPGSSVAESKIDRRIVLVSDLQEGARLDVLAEYPWPDDVRLDLRALKSTQTTNAGLHWRAERSADEHADGPKELRVQVSNDAASSVDEFQLTWRDSNGRPIGSPHTAYVPAGESRVLRVPRSGPAIEAQQLRLTGDECEFDNSLYLATRPQSETRVIYIGSDPGNDPQQPRYYLERALANGLPRTVDLVTAAADDGADAKSVSSVPLIVVTSEPTADQSTLLDRSLESDDFDGSLLFVLTDKDPPVKVLARLLDVPDLEIEEANVNGYTMLGQIDFDDRLFSAMAGPQFNDFTQIHFWKYRRLRSEQFRDAKVLARFENGDPALLEMPLQRGRAYVLASGWHPVDSQLARSWKFVLLVLALVNEREATRTDRTNYTVGEPVALDDENGAAIERAVIKPDGERVLLSSEARKFEDTDQPGIYSLVTSKVEETFAVNLDPAESRTTPVEVESLEQLGCRLVGQAGMQESDQRRAQLRDVQLESRQKMWQWLVAIALGMLVVETWLAGRVAKLSLAKPVTT